MNEFDGDSRAIEKKNLSLKKILDLCSSSTNRSLGDEVETEENGWDSEGPMSEDESSITTIIKKLMVRGHLTRSSEVTFWKDYDIRIVYLRRMKRFTWKKNWKGNKKSLKWGLKEKVLGSGRLCAS